MSSMRRLLAFGLGAIYGIAFLTGVGCGSPPAHESRGAQLFESPQADPIVLSPDGTRLYAVLTTDGKVRVIDTANLSLLKTIDVGTDPVSVALRPDGRELWVANHVSDSVSVISLAPGPARYTVVETIQAVDATNLITAFDEPVGIAFASNSKAYVALSSRNQIAIVDADSYAVEGFLAMNAQEPRAMRVRNGYLFVPAFESGNRSELSSCVGPAPERPPDDEPDDRQCTFDFQQANFAQNPQLVGFEVDIRKDPVMPDRDLFVFDTATDRLADVVEGVGTLLYGLTVDSGGRVFIAQTDARNAVNGRAGTELQGLADLDNRMFLNQVGVVDCSGGTCEDASVFELEALPPAQPTPDEQLATPYGIEISGNDQVLVGTAASSSRVFTMSAAGEVLDVLNVGNGPRGIALRSDPATGAPLTAYVLNTLDDSVWAIDVRDPGNIVEAGRLELNGDSTPIAIRRGRIAFNSAAGSTTGTFSCASCHPDGHVDQLLWVIGARCTFGACAQEEARSTMPVRGLKGTLPLHWDGTLGDPFTSINGEVGAGGFNVPANCTDDQSCFRHLVNASLSGVMCDQAACPTNDVDELGGLTNVERDDMATYLQSIQYPPARTRSFDDRLTTQAVAGFSDFFENKGGINPPDPAVGAGPETCADNANGSGCHALPHGAGTASRFVGGFEAPTMRGITDRFLMFSAGVTVVRDILEAASATNGTEVLWSPDVGFDELTTWAVAFGSPTNNIAFRSVYNVAAFNIFQMIEEMSNGQSGALGRQVTLNQRSTTGAALAATESMLLALELADLNGLVNLGGSGIRGTQPMTLSFRADATYQGATQVLTHAELISEAALGTLTLTLTASQRAGITASTVQPTLWVPPATTDFFRNGRPALPVLGSGNPASIQIKARNVQAGAQVLVDGAPVALDRPIACVNGTLPSCTANNITIDIATEFEDPGLYLLQVQNPNGLLTNELPVRRP